MFSVFPHPIEPMGWIWYNIIRNSRIEKNMKGQDIVVLSVLMKGDVENPSYQYISKSAKISVSEAHASIKRLYESDLVNSDRHLKKRNAN